MLWTIAATVFVTTFCLVYGFSVSWAQRNRVKVRAAELGPMNPGALLHPPGKASRFRKWSAEWLAFSGGWALPDLDKVSALRQDLILAGYRHPKAPAIYLGFRVVTALALPLPLLLYFIIQGKLSPISFLMAFALSLLGFYLPAKILWVRIRGRQNRLDRALPDILDLLVISMDAGLSLNAALHRVAEEIRGVFEEFYEELQITAAELRGGITWDEAFENLVKRTGVPSIRSMVGLMVQSGKLGGSIGDALREHSEFTRTQRLLRAEEQAAKLPVKMVIPMLFCIFPAIVIVVIGPGIIHICTKFISGGFMSGGAAGFGKF
jgi:tight adherence protein C